MLVSDFLHPQNMVFDAQVESKADLLRQVTEHLAASGAISDAKGCHEALLDRERLMTTGVGKGVALPHAFSPAASETVIAYFRVNGGVPFEAVDEQPVMHVFCILGPPSAQGRHLKILARLARLLNHPDFLEMLGSVSTPEDLISHIRAQEDAL